MDQKKWIIALLAGATFVLGGCVTINVYFPAAAAERAADKLIDEIWKIKKQEQQRDGNKTTPAASNVEVKK